MPLSVPCGSGPHRLVLASTAPKAGEANCFTNEAESEQPEGEFTHLWAYKAYQNGYNISNVRRGL